MSFDDMKKAVDTFFSDTSRSQEETLTDLRTMVEEIEIMIESLEAECE